jgi:hypothetical protein
VVVRVGAVMMGIGVVVFGASLLLATSDSGLVGGLIGMTVGAVMFAAGLITLIVGAIIAADN